MYEAVDGLRDAVAHIAASGLHPCSLVVLLSTLGSAWLRCRDKLLANAAVYCASCYDTDRLTATHSLSSARSHLQAFLNAWTTWPVRTDLHDDCHYLQAYANPHVLSYQ